MRGISDKQRQILSFIREYTASQGYPPSVREIGAAVGLRSPSSVHAHVKRLHELGYLEKDDRKTRAITLAGGTAGGDAVPILGRVAAGMPILAVEEAEGVLHTDLDGRPGPFFALRIRGDSMIEAGILDGDYIVVRSQNYAQDGQIVVAVIEDEATCKRLEQRDGHIWLMPENPAYSPIPGDNAYILGVVAKVVRTYPI
ncbi:MAG TPA: transcriptional repressor LexA [Clostridiales bacterium]|nr:transcriptional repressor LexA [Clostridiales bacterium]